jgi:hypothetical protein
MREGVMWDFTRVRDINGPPFAGDQIESLYEKQGGLYRPQKQ